MANKNQKKSELSESWRRVLDRLRRRRTNQDAQTSITATGPRAQKTTDIERAIDLWTEQEQLSANQQQSTDFLKQQLNEYQLTVERRRRRLLHEMRPTFFAVTGSVRASPSASTGSKRLSPTDDALPYEPKPLKLGHTSKTDSASPTSDESLASSESSSSVSVSETSDDMSDNCGGQLTDLLKSIIEDARITKRQKTQRDFTEGELLKMSRQDKGEFEKLMKENTKAALFWTQPTLEESNDWLKRKPRTPNSQTRCANDVTFTAYGPDEIITYCNVCKPRRYVRWLAEK